jgi:hypothetical protein
MESPSAAPGMPVPQASLFMPGSRQKEGKNSLVVFNLQADGAPVLQIADHALWVPGKDQPKKVVQNKFAAIGEQSEGLEAGHNRGGYNGGLGRDHNGANTVCESTDAAAC